MQTADSTDSTGPPGPSGSPGPPGPPGLSAPPGPGERAPDFGLLDQHGQTVDLAGFAGRCSVLLVFYPYAFSRVCGSELTAIRKDLDDFQNDRVQVLAVSCDSLYSLRAYADAEDFGFPLLADHWPHGAAARAYGVFDEGRGCAVRGTFLIDPSGVVRWSVVNGLAEARDPDDYRAAIGALEGVRG